MVVRAIQSSLCNFNDLSYHLNYILKDPIASQAEAGCSLIESVCFVVTWTRNAPLDYICRVQFRHNFLLKISEKELR